MLLDLCKFERYLEISLIVYLKYVTVALISFIIKLDLTEESWIIRRFPHLKVQRNSKHLYHIFVGQHDSKDYNRYMSYINNSKDRSHGTGTPSDKRSRSAVSSRSRSAVSRSTAKTDR